MGLMRIGNWPAADAAAAQIPDPVARKLVLFFRLLAPNAASLGEISGFLADSPDWPQRATLARRRDDALANEPDDTAVLSVCDHPAPAPPVATAAARLRCAEAFGRAGRNGAATDMIRRAWVDGPSDPAWESAFMQRWGATIRREDQMRRFDRLAWSDVAGARRQALRLDAADRPLAEARIALKSGDASALALAGVLSPAQRATPGIVLEQARWLRRAGREDEALALWKDAGAAAERAAPAERIALFWEERNALARQRLREGDNAGAYALASGHARYPAEQAADAEFLAGFVALRRLNDAASAALHFAALLPISRAAQTLSRAHYWLARAAAARGDADGAKAESELAAAWPSTYYGQLAVLGASAGPGDPVHLAERITQQIDPPADPEQAVAFAGRELSRAAALLVAWGEPGRAAGFLLRLADIVPDPTDRTLNARLAGGFGLADVAVAISRRAGRDGVMLLQTGWPVAVEVPPDAGVDPALVLGVIRQESSFDTSTVSPAGARGLMQLMPATAAETAKQLGLPVAIPALLTDQTYNMQLGTAFLRGLLTRYGGAIPLAVAGYNAGPGRVADWLSANGDPRAAETDVVDWIELISIGETRNYVQRVIENTVIYRAKLGTLTEHPLASLLH
jgi:soluble lytic murein transglycosylase